MTMNSIQFQPGMSLAQFLRDYGTEAKCYRALYKSRWPRGFQCPACGGHRRSRFRREGRVYYQCRKCRHQATLTSGTLFEHSQLPLTTRMLALYLLTSTKTDLSALELMRHLGVNYKAAWCIKHKVMQAMAEREATRKLDGFVQIDDAYLGGEPNGGKVGRGAPGKQAFVAAVETDQALEHPRYAVLEPVRTFDNASLTDWCQRRLAPKAELYSDGLACFARGVDTGNAHTVLVTEAVVPPARCLAPAGSTSCWRTSNAPSAAATTRSSKANMRDAIWPKLSTDSTGGFALPRCCRV